MWASIILIREYTHYVEINLWKYSLMNEELKKWLGLGFAINK